jgi:transposase-like protein
MRRLKGCESVTELSKELGIHRTLLYKWRERMEARESQEGAPVRTGDRKLRAEISELKRVLAEKTLEADFFKGALQKVEARRQSKIVAGGKASTPKSGS